MHAEAMEEGPKNPYGNGFIGVETPLTSESKAARVADGSKGTYWKINNPASRHASTGTLSTHNSHWLCFATCIWTAAKYELNVVIDALAHNMHLCRHQVRVQFSAMIDALSHSMPLGRH